MKIALPIALLVFGMVMVVLLLTPRHWNERTYADWLSDNDKIEEAKQKWFETNPEMKAEDLDLHKKYQMTDETSREAKNKWYEIRRSLNDHDQKIRDELIKDDPSLKSVYDRLGLDERVPFAQGDQELFAKFGIHPPPSSFDMSVMLFRRFFPALTFGIGLVLLVRPPSWAGAHLFLIFTILPLVLFGPMMLRAGIQIYLIRFDGWGDYSSVPSMLLNIHRDLVRDYLYYIPTLLIYILLLFRIHFRERKGKITASPAQAEQDAG